MKKLVIFLLASYSWLASNSQTITDTLKLRQAINSYIQPNGLNQINAAQLNRILNGVVNVLPSTGGGGSYGVSTFKGRFGAVVPVAGDYSIGMITGAYDSLRKRYDSVTSNLKYTKYTDTSLMLSGYGRYGQIVKYIDTATMLATRLKTSDTATMLANRLKISDTASALSGYQRKNFAVKYTDSASMLSGYAALSRSNTFTASSNTFNNAVNTGILTVSMPSSGTGATFRYNGGTKNPGLFIETNESTGNVSLTASGSLVSGQLLQLGGEGVTNTVKIGASSVAITGTLSSTGSITGNSFVKSGGTSSQILAADGSVITAGTNITISGGTISSSNTGGTVTSVATNTGSGITGGTITTSGTISADTSILSTKLNVLNQLNKYTGTSNTVTVGALTSGSIGGSFGSINIGSNNLTSGALFVNTPSSGDGATFRYTGGTKNPGLFVQTIESTGNVKLTASGSSVPGQLLQFGAEGTEGVLNVSAAKVGVNTTSPNASLEVAGTSANTDFRISRTVSSSTYLSISAPGGSPSTSVIGINGIDVLSLSSSGAGSFTGSIAATGLRLGYASKSSNYSVTDDDYHIKTTATCTITLPLASGRTGKRYVIVATAGTTTISTSGGDSVYWGGTTLSPTLNGANPNVLVLFSDGSTSWIIESYISGA